MMSVRNANRKYNDAIRTIIQLTYSSNARKPSFMSLAKKYYLGDSEEKDKVSRDMYLLLEDISTKIFNILEAGTRGDCLNRASRILGTLFLLSPFEDSTAPVINKKFKVLYRVVASIRFLDELLFEGKCRNEYMKKYWKGYSRFEEIKDRELHKEMVIKPIIYSIFCEIAGFEHPQSIRLLKGDKSESRKDEFRVLEPDERDRLKNISINAGNELLASLLSRRHEENAKNGSIIGNDTDFTKFCRSIVNHTYNSNKELGSAFKICQIYTSSIIPSRRNIKRLDTVKTLSYVSSHVESGLIQKSITVSFYSMFGLFPQGFGITCIPNEKRPGNTNFTYEMAIVNKFYPDEISAPYVRVVTRNKEFDRGFSDEQVSKDRNLFFPATQSRINKKSQTETFKKILKRGQKLEDLLAEAFPRCWDAHEFYSTRECSLWNNVNYEVGEEEAA